MTPRADTLRGLLIALLAVATQAAARAATPPALVCVRQAQVDRKACQTLARQAGDECSANYFAAVPPCFGASAPCASDCITTRTGCVTGPEDHQIACAAACDQRATSVRAGCKGRPATAVQACSLTAKLKSLKCKQKCARTAALPLQRCSLDFDACLKACATQTGS